MSKYVCTICGYIYDEEAGIPEAGISPGTKWEELPDDWKCPLCGASKVAFRLEKAEQKENLDKVEVLQKEIMREMTFAELSALCSNLEKGCEKQYLGRESELFHTLSLYYQEKAVTEKHNGLNELIEKVTADLDVGYAKANSVADERPDRGAKRALVWSEKVTRMLDALLERYEKEKDGMLLNTDIYVCEICGFIYVDNTPPEICPVCKVPNKKMTKIERGE